MAEAAFQVKIAAMQNQSADKNQQDVLFERFKIEDEIFIQFGVEIEHFLLLHEESNEEGSKNP